MMKRAIWLGFSIWLLVPAIAAGQGTQIESGTSNPPTCSIGMLFLNISSSILYTCSATNTWSSVIGAGGSPGGSTGQVQVRSSSGTFAPGLVWYASQFPGTGCAKINAALNAASANGGWVYGDFTGTIDCTNGISIPGGVTLYLPPNLTLNPLGGAGTGAGIVTSGGSHLICGGTNPSAGTVITAGNYFNRPMIQTTADGHWQEIANCRLEGNRANQTSATITSASRTSNTNTITTSTAHNLHVNDIVYIDNVTDASFNGTQTVSAIVSGTQFRYATVGLTDASSSGGTATGGVDGIYMYRVGENLNIHHNYVETTSGSCFRFSGNMSPSGSFTANTCFDGGRYVYDFDGANGDFHIIDGSDSANWGVFGLYQTVAYLKVTVDRMKTDSPISSVPNWAVARGGNGRLTCKHCGIYAGPPGPRDAILVRTGSGAWSFEIENSEIGTEIGNIINDQGAIIPVDRLTVTNHIEHWYYDASPGFLLTVPGGNGPQGFINTVSYNSIASTTENVLIQGNLARLMSANVTGGCDTFTGFGIAAIEGASITIHNPYNCQMGFNDEDTSNATPSQRIRTGTGNVRLPPGQSWATFTYLWPKTPVANNGFTRASNEVTVTTSYRYNFNVGDNVTISGASGCATSVNGTFAIAGIPTNTTFTFNQTGGNETCGGSAASVSLPRWWLTGSYPPVPRPFGSTSQKNETAADANVLTFTPPAGVGSYRVRFVMSVSAANAATLGWTATWKDSNGKAQGPTNLSLYQSGTAAPALTYTTSRAGNYYGQADIDVDNSATPIVIKLTFTGTSFAAKVSATVEKVL